MLKNFKGVFIGIFFLPSPSFSYKEDLWREHKNKVRIKAGPGLLYFRSSLIPGRFSAAGARRRDARASQYWMMDHFGIHFHFHPWRCRGRGPHRVPHRVGGAGD